MQWTKAGLLATIMLMFSASAAAQEPRRQDAHEELAKIEIFGGYSYLREEGTNFNGWNAALEGNLNPWLALVADFDGHYATEEGTHIHDHGFTFGPQFALRGHGRLVPFTFILLGGAHRSTSTAGMTQTTNELAMNIGGGLDFEATKRFSIRLFQLDASRIWVAGDGTTSMRLGFGLVFPLGHRY